MNRPDIFDMYTQGFPAGSQYLPLAVNGVELNYEQEPIERPNGLPFNTWLQIISGSGEVIVDRKKSRRLRRDGYFTQSQHTLCLLCNDRKMARQFHYFQRIGLRANPEHTQY